MKLVRALGFVAVVAGTLMTVGPASAMAEGSTTLCRFQETPCGAAKRAAGIHAVAEVTKWELGMLTVECLSSLVEGPVEGAALSGGGEFLKVEAEILTWNKCGTNANHNNCEVTNLVLPLFDILNFPGLSAGGALALNWEVKLNCPLLVPNCVYGELEAFFFHNPPLITHGGYFAIEASMTKLGGGMTCPATAAWTASYDHLENLWVTS